MQLIGKETYERAFKTSDEPIPVFILRKLTYGEMASIGDETSVMDEQNRIVYKGGTTGKLKVKYSLVGWRNITDETGKEVPCTDANKEKLPPDIAQWLINEIDILNKLKGIPGEETKN